MKLLATSLLLAAASLAHGAANDGNWLTIAGDPADASADYIQIDPTAVVARQGLQTIPVRVSRVRQRTTKDGVNFRSFEGIAGIDCQARSARYLESSFYAAPDFAGESFRTDVYPPTDERPMAFREIKGNPTQRIVRAACSSRRGGADKGAKKSRA